jgi:hypothetical protein
MVKKKLRKLKLKENFKSHFLFLVMITTYQKIIMIRHWFSNQDSSLEIFNLLIKCQIMNTIWFYKMILIPKVTPNGFSLELIMLKEAIKLNLICSIWSSPKVYTMREWKSLFILLKDKNMLNSYSKLQKIHLLSIFRKIVDG